jgi:hypothetical protein
MPTIHLGACGASGGAHCHLGREAAAQEAVSSIIQLVEVPLRADQASTTDYMIRQQVARISQELLYTSTSSIV